MNIIFIIILNYEKLKLIRTVKDIITIQNMSFKTKVFLKFPKSMRVFFISSIGPTTKNPIIEFKENKVIIDGTSEYLLYENKFIIEQFGEKKLTLKGDL